MSSVFLIEKQIKISIKILNKLLRVPVIKVEKLLKAKEKLNPLHSKANYNQAGQQSSRQVKKGSAMGSVQDKSSILESIKQKIRGRKN